jgi:integrase
VKALPTIKRSKYNKTDSEMEEKINPENLKLWRKYEQDMTMRELSPKSIYQYKRDIMQWLSYLVEFQFNPVITDVTDDDIEEFIFWCKQNGNNVERIKRRLSSISAFYIYLRRKKLCQENPCEFIVRPKRGLPVVVQTFLTEQQYEQMKQALKDNGDLQLETYARLSIDTMARVNAVSSLRWEQIDFEHRTIEDVLEKERKIVTLYFSEETKELLLKLKAQRETDGIDNPYIFLASSGTQASVQTLTEWCRKVGKLIGIDTLHPHDFRHSGSQLMNLKGAPIELISELLSHSSLTVTKEHYLKIDKAKMMRQKDLYQI